MTPAQLARRFARVYTPAITDVMDEMGLDTEGKVRQAVKRGMLPLRAYERYGAF